MKVLVNVDEVVGFSAVVKQTGAADGLFRMGRISFSQTGFGLAVP